MEPDSLTPVLEQNLSRQLSWVAAADAKTAFVFGVAMAMLGVLASAAPAFGKWTTASVTWLIIAGVPLVACLASLTLAVFPRTTGPKLSNIFFGSISAKPIDTFRSEVMSLDAEGYLEDLIQQVHINAQIAGVKFAWVKRATIYLFSSLFPWILATYYLFRDK